MEISDLAVVSITNDRVELFGKSLKSIARDLEHSNLKSRIAVFDDSSRSEVRIEKRGIVEDLKTRHEVSVDYYGLEEKEAFLQDLGRDLKNEGVDRGLLAYAFFGDPDMTELRGPGGNHNTATLAAAGKRLLSFDDDTEMRAVSRIGTERSLQILDKKVNLEYAAFKEHRQLEDFLLPCEENLFHQIDSFLGKSASRVMEDFQIANPADNTITPGDTIKTVMTGIFGGRWSQQPFGILYGEGPLRDAMYRNRREYEAAKLSPYSFLQAPGFFLSRSPLIIATAFGMDNRTISPPFIPGMRNSDNIWGIIYRQCYREAFTAYFPFAITHDFANKRPFTKEEFDDTHVNLGMLTLLVIEETARRIPPLQPEEILIKLGSSLIGASRLDDESWAAFTRTLWFRFIDQTEARLTELLDKHNGQPRFWAKDISAFIRRLKGQSLEPEASFPRELLVGRNGLEAGALHRKIIGDYGRLLQAWPGIWEAARRINAE